MLDPPLVLSIGAVIEAEVLIEPFKSVQLNEPSFVGSVEFIPSLGMLAASAIINGSYKKFAIGLKFHQNLKSIVPYFRCGNCGKRCLLVINDDAVSICSEDYLKHGALGSQRVRRALLREARDGLAAIQRRRRSSWIPYERWLTGERYADRYEAAAAAATDAFVSQVRSRRGQRQIVPDTYSTARGIALGRGAIDYAVVDRYRAEGDLLVDRLRESQASWPSPLTTAPLAETPVMDINQLVAENSWVKPDSELIAFTMKWPGGEPLIIIDGRSDQPHMIVSHDWGNLNNPKWQLIDVRDQANGRQRFICPVDGSACDKLYLRNGYFASRAVHRLFHASQRGAARPRSRMSKSAHSGNG